ncbi:MAG: GNAT family N-acetyltransferase [Chitinophagaceae bacterium]|jgi:N-acetylglutamate synthase-like GNAT family acetyltransferase
MPLSIAVPESIDALVKLVNSAYRGEISTKGWTTEAHLLKGSLRTDRTEIQEIFADEQSIIVQYTNESNVIIGCVHLQIQDTKLYLGMLSVSPFEQAKGIGKQLLAAAENYAKEKQLSAIFMTVIDLRVELIEWYKRNGYSPTGETKPFDIDELFGIPVEPLHFIVLEKKLV